MKNKIIAASILALSLMMTFPTLAFAATSGTQIKKNVDGVQATLSFDKDNIKTGSNEFTISLTDSNGNPVSDANLQVTADMDRSDMGNDGMSNDKPMMIDMKDGSTKGEYVGTVDLSKEGKWIISTSFNISNQTKKVDFDFNVKSKGPNMLLVGGFAGLVVIIIAVAAISKKRKNA